MTAEALAWWWTFGSGVALGAVVTAVACGRLRRVQRLFDRILDDVAPPKPYRKPYQVVPIGTAHPPRRPPPPQSQSRPPKPPPRPRSQLHPPPPPPPPSPPQLHVRLVDDREHRD